MSGGNVQRSRVLQWRAPSGSLSDRGIVRDGSAKRILVTGGAGFLGSHLIEKLLELGHEVVCVDNFSTGSLQNLGGMLLNKRLSVLDHDIVLPLDAGSFDEIYNLACPASPPHYQADPVQTTKTCVIGALNVLEIARASNARILQASTSEVYGDPTVHPQPEIYWGNVNPTGPRACYDEGKRCAESLFFDYARMYGVGIKVARIFNTYGPRMRPDDGRVVSNFVVQALKGEDITIYGSGSQTRSFCYVSDLVEGLMRLMASPEEVTGPVNLGNPGEFTIGELASIVVEMTGSQSQIVYCDLPIDDPRQRRPDITKAKDVLGWLPHVTLKDGLVQTIDYFASAEAATEIPQPLSAASAR
ncbi:UDP-glucuronic acid decarboxylase family protein [Microvirga sp. BSC39]|uniref:UDP-glucuronic acid decarboxylase family protein n=1 Tax=Microvirga sp. BSC39 TaxID=1549810 RepID=UPI0006917DB0|nr:UDP-glucuronic acid decarboxylase family protein [Microvirga sp. BSC39]